PRFPPRAPSFEFSSTGQNMVWQEHGLAEPANPNSSPDMPKVGIEPTRPFGHRILSPARLPVPPLRRGFSVGRLLGWRGAGWNPHRRRRLPGLERGNSSHGEAAAR